MHIYTYICVAGKTTSNQKKIPLKTRTQLLQYYSTQYSDTTQYNRAILLMSITVPLTVAVCSVLRGGDSLLR